MEAHQTVGDTTTNKNGAETCENGDCRNSYTPFCIGHSYYCVTCGNELTE
jgi:hypothetical protein